MVRGERTVVPMTRRTRRERSVLVTKVTFEVGRLGAICLVEAYERAVPIARGRPRDGRMRPLEQCPVGRRAGEERGR